MEAEEEEEEEEEEEGVGRFRLRDVVDEFVGSLLVLVGGLLCALRFERCWLSIFCFFAS